MVSLCTAASCATRAAVPQGRPAASTSCINCMSTVPPSSHNSFQTSCSACTMRLLPGVCGPQRLFPICCLPFAWGVPCKMQPFKASQHDSLCCDCLSSLENLTSQHLCNLWSFVHAGVTLGGRAGPDSTTSSSLLVLGCLGEGAPPSRWGGFTQPNPAPQPVSLPTVIILQGLVLLINTEHWCSSRL